MRPSEMPLPLFVLLNESGTLPFLMESPEGPTFIVLSAEEHAITLAIACERPDLKVVSCSSTRELLSVCERAQVAGALVVDVRFELIPESSLPQTFQIAEYLDFLRMQIAREGQAGNN